MAFTIDALVTAKRGTAEVDVAVTNGNDVAFELTTDNANEDLPVGCWIVGVTVQPHNAADPKVAVATKWRIRFYTRYVKGIEDLRYEYTIFGEPASDDISLDNTEWQYENADGCKSIYGTIGIEGAATNCTFTIAVEFERRR